MFAAPESSAVMKLRRAPGEPPDVRPAIARAGDERLGPARLAQAALAADRERHREQSTFRARLAAALCRALSAWTT
jgi:hypothetical protein